MRTLVLPGSKAAGGLTVLGSELQLHCIGQSACGAAGNPQGLSQVHTDFFFLIQSKSELLGTQPRLGCVPQISLDCFVKKANYCLAGIAVNKMPVNLSAEHFDQSFIHSPTCQGVWKQ